MSGNARFHDKLHRSNHHTTPTPGLPDSANDPIASPAFPFQGNFVVNGSVSAANSVVSKDLLVTNSATVTGNLTVNGPSTFNNSVNVLAPLYLYNLGAVISDGINTNNNGPLTLTLNFLQGVFIQPSLTVGVSINTQTYYGTNFTGTSAFFTTATSTSSNSTRSYAATGAFGTVTVANRLGVNVASPQFPVHIVGDVVIYGNLTANGTSTFQNTTFSTTSALSVFNSGTGAALTVTQTGDQPIVAFYDHESAISLFADGSISRPGWVGVKTLTPNVEFTVNGSISAKNFIYGTIPGYSNITATSGSWNLTYTTVSQNSATWSAGGAGGSGFVAYTNLTANSASWVTTYNTVNANSAAWNAGGGGNAQGATAYTNLTANSASWGLTYTTVSTSSARWNLDYTVVSTSSANWNTAFTYVTSNSATTRFSSLTASTAVFGVMSLTGANIQTLTTEVTASADYLFITLNGVVRKIRLWD